MDGHVMITWFDKQNLNIFQFYIRYINFKLKVQGVI